MGVLLPDIELSLNYSTPVISLKISAGANILAVFEMNIIRLVERDNRGPAQLAVIKSLPTRPWAYFAAPYHPFSGVDMGSLASDDLIGWQRSRAAASAGMRSL